MAAAEHAEHAEHSTDTVQPPEEHIQSQPQPEASNKTPKLRRKTSFSDASSRFAFETFSRRRMSTNLPHPTSLASVHTQSRLPTPSGIPRTTSYFSNLSSLNSDTTTAATSTRQQIESPEKSATNNDGESNNNGNKIKADFPKSTSTSGIPIAPASTQKKVGPNLAPSHPRVFTPQHHLTGPVTPTSTNTQKSKTASGNPDAGSDKSKTRRESSVHIPQHKLMQPLPPPLPKANRTMSSLMTGTSKNVVGGARTSVGGKRGSGGMVGGNGSGNANVDAKTNTNVGTNVSNKPNPNPNTDPDTTVSKGSSVTAGQTQTETKTKTETEIETLSPLAPKANAKTETQAKTETLSLPATTKANAKSNSPAQTQPQTQSPPDVNKPLPEFHTNPLYVRHPPFPLSFPIPISITHNPN